MRSFVKNDSRKIRQLKLQTWAGLVFLLIPIGWLFIWIYAFNKGANQLSRVEIYLQFFPSFLGTRGISILGLVFCIISFFLSVRCLFHLGLKWKLLNAFILVGSFSMFLLQLWGIL